MALAANPEFPAKTFGPYTLNAAAPTNYPSDAGVRVSEFDADCMVQLAITAGVISVDVEAQLQGSGAWVNTGTLSTSGLNALTGPLDFVRFHVTTCTGGCSALGLVRCRSGQ
jgi:hypothetical protein